MRLVLIVPARTFVTVAILAQGTSRAVAYLQTFFAPSSPYSSHAWDQVHFGDTKHRPKPATYLTDLPGFGLPRQILIFRETQAKQGVFLDFQNYEIEGFHRKGQNRPNTATYLTDF